MKILSRWFFTIPTIFILVGISLAVVKAVPNPETLPPPSAEDLNRIGKRIQEKVSAHSDVLAFTIFDVKVGDVRFASDNQWALASLTYVDRSDGSIVPTEPGLALAHRQGNDWQITLQVDPEWGRILQEAPAELLGTDMKSMLTLPEPSAPKAFAKALGGYKLPWTAGQQKALSQSIGHGSGQSYYAFDFFDVTERNWPIVASRSGVVKYAVWTYPDNYHDGNCNHANYLVLEDTSTTPTTYQVYLHLQYNSIPAAIRAAGTRVYRGQFLGIAGNTGCSSGAHLHFQVHTNVYSWWGTSLDIKFDDVAMNGGRPRTAAEMSGGQTWYTSGNTSGTDHTPPTADLSAPTDHTTASQNTLHLAGWASDSQSGFSHAYFIANYGSGWEQIGPVFPTSPFSYDWDMCASGVPLGPLAVSLRAWDRDGLPVEGLPGLRNIVHTASCPVTPPSCTPSADQVALFADVNYGGACVIKGVGNYSESVLLQPLGDDAAESLVVGANVRATGYSESGYSGRSETFSGNEKNLGDHPIGARTISSLRVVPRSQAAETPTLVWPLPNVNITQGDSFLIHWRGGTGTELFGFDLPGYRSVPAQALPYLMVEGYAPGLGSRPWYVHACNSYWPPLENCSNEWGTGQWTVVSAPIWAIASGTPFVDHLEGDTSRWEVTGLWRLSTGIGSNPTRAWVYNNGTNYDTGHPNGGFLTSPPVAIPVAGYFLHFRSWNDTEPGANHWDQRYVQIAKDGGAFQTVLRMTDEETRTWGQGPVINLSAYAGHTIRVRFSFTTLDEINNQYGGWAVDDLSIDTVAEPACNDSHESNNTSAFAISLPAGSSSAGQICPGGDVDFYKFTANAGDHVIAKLTGMSGLAPHLDILDTNGVTTLASADANSIGIVVDQTGTYFIKVRSRFHPSAGGADQGYTVQLSTDADVPAVSFTFPAASGSYAGGNALPISVSATDSGGIQKVQIYSHSPDWETGDWTLLCTDTEGVDGWSCPLDTNGFTPGGAYAFYARVTDWVGNQSAAAVWNITFRLDTVAPIVAMTPLASLMQSSQIPLYWTANDAHSGIDHFDIQVNADDSGWRTWRTGLSAGISQINYFGQLGHSYLFRVIAFDKAGNSAQAEANTTTASCGADSFEPDDSFVHAATIDLGVSQSHSFCGVGDQDWVSFNAIAGNTYWIHGIPTSALASLWFSIFNTNGTTLLADYPNAPDHLNAGISAYWRAPANGVYYLRAQHSNSEIAGPSVTYQIIVSFVYDEFLPVVLR